MSSWKKGISVYLDGETDDSLNEVLPRCCRVFMKGKGQAGRKIYHGPELYV